MSQFARQHPSVQLVELHQLDQVGEFGGAVVKAEEDLAVLFALRGGGLEGGTGRAGERTRGNENIFLPKRHTTGGFHMSARSLRLQGLRPLTGHKSQRKKKLQGSSRMAVRGLI